MKIYILDDPEAAARDVIKFIKDSMPGVKVIWPTIRTISVDDIDNWFVELYIKSQIPGPLCKYNTTQKKAQAIADLGFIILA